MSELFRITWPETRAKYYLFNNIRQKKTNIEYEAFIFRKGEKVKIDEDLYTNHEPWGKNYTDFHFGIGDECYLNEQFLNCLKAVGETNYQVFPIQILPEEKPYYVLNILNVVDCVDRELSKFTLWTEEDERPDLLGTFYTFDKMILDRSKVPKGVHLFRLHGHEIVAVATRELVEEFEKNGIKGFKLIPLD